MNVACRSGGFHVITSFLGSIGHIMAGLGLVEVLQCCYESVSINHMIIGIVVARAQLSPLLNHISLLCCLIKLFKEETSSPLLSSEDIKELKTVYNDLFTSSVTTNDAILPSYLQKLKRTVITKKVKLRQQSRTSRLQCIDYMSLLKDFVNEHRTGWNLHIVSLTAMLNLFAASGHAHNAKSAHLYLQMMSMKSRVLDAFILFNVQIAFGLG